MCRFCLLCPLQTSSGIIGFNIFEICKPPVLPSEDIFVSDSSTTNNTFIWTIVARDPNTVPAWQTLTYSISTNPFYGSATNIFRIDPTSGALFWNASINATGALGVPCGGQKCVAIFAVGISVCNSGTPPACGYGTVNVNVLSFNQNITVMQITDYYAPPGGLNTGGGEVISFSGYGFPVGGAVTVFYGPFKLTSSDCSVRSPVYIVCSSVQGYGYGYTATVFIGVSEVPSTKPLVLSYAPPTVGSVAVIAPGTFTTAGSAPSAILITGGNFGSQAADLQVIFGQLVGAGSFPAIVTSWTHTQIRVQAGPGCGQSIPVTVTVGGQTSAANPAAVISYPAPIIGSLALSALSQSLSLTTLNTRGGDTFMVNGTNFGGPNAITPMQVQYACGGMGQYVYTTTCTRDATNPHTYAACPTVAGVGAGCTLSATVCSATSVVYDGMPVAYAPPIVTSVTGPGALRASTEGNQGASSCCGSAARLVLLCLMTFSPCPASRYVCSHLHRR